MPKEEGKNEQKAFALFNKQPIRRVWHNEQWYFTVVDVVRVLTGSGRPDGYIKDMRRRDEELAKGWWQIATPLLIKTSGGIQKINCANTQGILRIIQSIPSSKAEPFKRWLAKIGQERIQEIENPELAMGRMKAIYEKKGYPKEWIDKRARGIAIRHSLTDEWRDRGIKHGMSYAILTNEIMESAFGLKVEEAKKIKGLKRENLRDHMDDMELILTMLGEATTTKLTKTRDSRGFIPLKKDAHDGGNVAGKTRKNIEKLTGEKVLTPKNFLDRKVIN